MKIELFAHKKDCCSCGACANICPKNAIKMQEDVNGFVYPQIDYNKCISCGACKKVCSFQGEHNLHEPIKAFAAVNKNKEQLMKSASGGVFSAIATYVIKNNGIVCGATLSFENGYAVPKHIMIDKLEDIPLLQGSKYVQSSIEYIYQEIKNYLGQDKTVLFSGTPCQVDGLYGYLGSKTHENLITIDLVCHGVPNARFLNDYLSLEKERHHAIEIENYLFRDKRRGWGMNNRIDMVTGKGTSKSINIPARLNSYNSLFLDGIIYRENCYSCPYAQKQRVGDLTIGDYWGIEKEHPELLKQAEFDERNGISCILANTNKGLEICENVGNILSECESTYEKVSHRNGQLKTPSALPNSRAEIMNLYAKSGYTAIDIWFRKKYRKQIMIHTIYNKIPRNFKGKLKRILKR